MRVRRKVISLLELSRAELDEFLRMLEEAKEGRVTHYSEKQTGPNQYFGISIQDSVSERRRSFEQ